MARIRCLVLQGAGLFLLEALSTKANIRSEAPPPAERHVRDVCSPHQLPKVRSASPCLAGSGLSPLRQHLPSEHWDLRDADKTNRSRRSSGVLARHARPL